MPNSLIKYVSVENDRLGNCQGIIQIAQCVKFPFLPLSGNENLFDTEKNLENMKISYKTKTFYA